MKRLEEEEREKLVAKKQERRNREKEHMQNAIREADELNLKRAEFFAKTILNAKRVAEFTFQESI